MVGATRRGFRIRRSASLTRRLFTGLAERGGRVLQVGEAAEHHRERSVEKGDGDP